MPFAKLKSDEMNGGALVADLEGTAFWQETLGNRLEEARQQRDSAIAELEAGDTIEDRAAQLLVERNKLVAAQTAKEAATKLLDAARKAVQDNRDAHAQQIDTVIEAQNEELACYEALSKAHSGAGAPPELTPAEVEWLSRFSVASSTPPSMTMTLQTDLQAAMLDTHAARMALEKLEAAYPDLVSAELQQQKVLSKSESQVLEMEENLRAREAANDHINRLDAAVTSIELQLAGTTGSVVSMPVVLLPFLRLAGELVLELDSLETAPDVTLGFTQAVASARSSLDQYIAEIDDLKKVTGDAMSSRLAEIDTLGAALNTLADTLDNLRAVALPQAMLEHLQISAVRRLGEFSQHFKYGGNFLQDYSAFLKRNIAKLDFSDPVTATAKVETLFNKASDGLEADAVQQLANMNLREKKRALFEAELLQYQGFQNGQKRFRAIVGMIDKTDCPMPDFEKAVQELKDLHLGAESVAAAKVLRLQKIAAGTILTLDQWRSALELPSSGYDIKDKINGTYNSRDWEVHLTLSDTSIQSRTEDIVMTNADRDTVFHDLLIAPLDWRFRVHATFRFADSDAPSHVYLGENWVYRDYLIPEDIRAARVADMQKLITDYTARAKAAIAQRIK